MSLGKQGTGEMLRELHCLGTGRKNVWASEKYTMTEVSEAVVNSESCQ